MEILSIKLIHVILKMAAPHLMPSLMLEAQFLDQMNYAICVMGTSGSQILSYALTAHVGENSCDESFETAPPKTSMVMDCTTAIQTTTTTGF